jgi:hypothetical protein
MQQLSWHDYLTVFSFFAAIAGLILAKTAPKSEEDAVEATDRCLFLMIFTYWSVYCVAAVGQDLLHSEWELALFSMRATALLSYFLTFTCIISLPLHRLAAGRQIE